jgi:hypothetical protein
MPYVYIIHCEISGLAVLLCRINRKKNTGRNFLIYGGLGVNADWKEYSLLEVIDGQYGLKKRRVWF